MTNNNILDYHTLKQKYDEYKEQIDLFNQLTNQYETINIQNYDNKDMSGIAIMDELEQIQFEIDRLRDEMLEYLIESKMFELFKKEVMKE